MLVSRKAKRGSDFGKITMILIGIGAILFASTCFKDVPLIGTVFLLPGDNITMAQVADPVVRYALFLTGGLFVAYGIQLQIRIGFCNPFKERNQNATPGKPATSRRKPWRKPWDGLISGGQEAMQHQKRCSFVVWSRTVCVKEEQR